ncbi:hypothetical protein AB9F41_33510, partial [Rhizobium leguminosarum]|uniref:hypothetical protein n=1 Tax=Rhizobium leguminosarum TaxID=384 RepID=UPI003F965578
AVPGSKLLCRMHGGERQHFRSIEFEIVIACPAEENFRIEMRIACRLGDLARASICFSRFGLFLAAMDRLHQCLIFRKLAEDYSKKSLKERSEGLF